jgi:glycopeptide antibiotics resistance protein
MIDLVLKTYELLAVLLPFIIVFAVLNKTDKENDRQNFLCQTLILCAFVVYIFAAFHFTGAGTVFDLLRNVTKPYYSGKFNLLPFADGISPMLPLNVLLFVPLGFLLPSLWPNTCKFKYVLFAGLFFSFFIEISQFYSYRVTDIDDLIANTAGALLGYLIYSGFAHITEWNNERPSHSKYEPFVYMSAMFFGHFLLYDAWGLRIMLFGF